VRRRLWIVAIILAVLVVVGLFAQETMLIGRYDDALYIDQPKDDTEQFVFARLIYNGRIPGYYKNWYTDYPKSDRTLLKAVKRLTTSTLMSMARRRYTDPISSIPSSHK
jgi:hypothetical protein